MTVKELMLDPITRLEGHAALHAKIDVEAKRYIDAHSVAGMFRGFEIILKGRDPPDATFITQRICGVCPVPHAYASALSLDMALKAPPPPLATILRNLTIAAELLYDHPIHLFQLAGPDYSAIIVKKFNKAWWSAAQLTLCEYRDVHGYTTIADLMEALNPLSGSLYLYTLKMERFSRKLASLLGAKHPHVNTFIPGGVARTWGASEAAQAFSMLLTLAGLSKLLVTVWEDLSRFLYDMGYEDAGLRPANLIAYGVMEDHETYDASYANMSKWGEKKYLTPGVVVNGELVTYDLKEIHRGIREYVEHSYYEAWSPEFTTDPEGVSLDSNHPWNKETLPSPQARSWDGKYTWASTPRWAYNGAIYVLEAGPAARIWAPALAGKVNFTCPFSEVKTGNGVVRISLPETRSEELPASLYDAMEVEWVAPKIYRNGVKCVNTIERNKARAYNHAYYAAVALLNALQMFELIKEGKLSVWKEIERPALSFGAGMTEAARGAVGHWSVVKGGKIHRYQVITPTAWNISPRDPEGNLGPIEEAVVNTPVTEDHGGADEWVGLDAVRVVRSYDPCLSCTVHAYIGGRYVKHSTTYCLTP